MTTRIVRFLLWAGLFALPLVFPRVLKADVRQDPIAAPAVSTATRTKTRTPTRTATRTKTWTPGPTFTPRPTSTVTATPALYAIDLHFHNDPRYTPNLTPTIRNMAIEPLNVDRSGPWTDLLTPSPVSTWIWPLEWLTRTPTPRPGHAPDRVAWAFWLKWNDGRWPESNGWSQARVQEQIIYEPSYGPTATWTRTPTRMGTFTRTATRSVTPGGPTFTPLPCNQIPPGAPLPCNTETPTPGGPTRTKTPTAAPTQPPPTGRFTVTVHWTKSDGTNGDASIVPLAHDSGSDTAAAWFFSAGNYELMMKMLNGCGINGKWWFFVGGLTNVKVDINVKDNSTGAFRTYTNSQGVAFQPVQDTSAFPCP